MLNEADRMLDMGLNKKQLDLKSIGSFLASGLSTTVLNWSDVMLNRLVIINIETFLNGEKIDLLLKKEGNVKK